MLQLAPGVCSVVLLFCRTLAETLELLEKQVQCSICLETYRDPKALACLHAYCRRCIQQLLLRQQQDQELECPQCRSIVSVADNDPSYLPTVFFINRLIEVYEILKRAESNQISCQNCSSDANATTFCHTCGFVCTACTNYHTTMKVFAGHETIPIPEMRERTWIRLPTMKSSTATCQKHEGEPVKLYCFECEQLICRDCTMVDHTGHSYDFVKGVADVFREEVVSSLTPLRDTHASVTTALARVMDSKKAVRDQSANVSLTITQSFQELHAILNNREQFLLQQTQEMMERKVCALESQQEAVELVLANLNILMGFVERTAKNASDEEFISMKQQMTSRVQEISEKYKCLELAPAEVANIGKVMPRADSLRELCQKQSEVYISVVDVSKCRIDDLDLQSVTIKQAFNFTVHTYDTHGQPTSGAQHVSAKLKSLVDGSVLQATVVSQTPSTYMLSITPTIRGHHQLTVRVNNTKIGTFQVSVLHPLTQLGAPVRVIKVEDVKPLYVAVSDRGELLVTEHLERRYTMLDAQGQRVLTIGSRGKPPFGDGCPTGIATDGEGSVYVASAHKVQKFNRHGEIVKSVGKKGRNAGEFDHPNGVKFYKYQVYVCDSDNGRVQVFDSNLNFVRLFGAHGDGPGQLKKAMDIDFDSQGNSYVIDEVKDQVLVFSGNGQYLYHFGQKGQSRGGLSDPGGLCISRDFVYITEWDNDCVSVFRTSGEFVHSFGKRGSSKGELISPHGIAIDKDSFVFVCDAGNRCIHVF